ncbi:MAG: Hsp20/alpha crystallin family protein [Planctomycetaceae bacterium]
MVTDTLSKIQERGRRFSLAPIEDEMRQLISRVFSDSKDQIWPAGSLGSLDLSETDNEITVRLDLPGVDAKEIDIQINGNLLTVAGERKEEKEEKDKLYHRVERRYGSFSRSVSLPCAVDQEQVDAQYCDGVLSIKLPKSDIAKSRKIEIKTSA